MHFRWLDSRSILIERFLLFSPCLSPSPSTPFLGPSLFSSSFSSSHPSFQFAFTQPFAQLVASLALFLVVRPGLSPPASITLIAARKPQPRKQLQCIFHIISSVGDVPLVQAGTGSGPTSQTNAFSPAVLYKLDSWLPL